MNINKTNISTQITSIYTLTRAELEAVSKPRLTLFSTMLEYFFYLVQLFQWWLFCRPFTLLQTDAKGGWYHYKNNRLHNDSGPAVYFTGGGKQVYIRHGIIHREDGPAIISGSSEYWLLNGKLHREDGPAVIYKDFGYWFLNGKFLTDQEIDEQKFKAFFSHNKNVF